MTRPAKKYSRGWPGLGRRDDGNLLNGDKVRFADQGRVRRGGGQQPLIFVLDRLIAARCPAGSLMVGEAAGMRLPLAHDLLNPHARRSDVGQLERHDIER
ncbi:hypothetical protein AB0M36_15640 [Actinoplanes sp. NPDC051346]|uniref:hypothetical protein n=1 Tax=Actinoplanes sp. NPDC051346 TaxID=3155048 RepID=UPI003428EDE3